MTIGELSKKSGVPPSTLRYWERIKVLPRVQRVSGRRSYQPDSVDLVSVLRLAKDCGFSLIEMRRLVNGFNSDTPASKRWQAAIRDHQRILDQQVKQLCTMRRLLRRVQLCKCADLRECGRIASVRRGEKLVTG